MSISTNFYTTNNQSLKLSKNTNFRGSQISIPQDKPDIVEIQGKNKEENKKGLSTNAKIGIGLGVIATVVGGLLLHKNFAKKVSSESKQVTKELSNEIKIFSRTDKTKKIVIDFNTPRGKQILQSIQNGDINLYNAITKNKLKIKFNGVEYDVDVKANANMLTDLKALVEGKSYIPSYKNEPVSQILKETGLGDVISINEQMYLNNGKTLEKLAFDEKTYKKLFPPIYRYNINQSKTLGNCYFISNLEATMNNPKGRCELYRMFSQDSKGNLYVKTASNSNAILVDNINLNVPHSTGCQGLSIIEQVYGAGTKKANINKLSQIDKTMVMDAGGYKDGNIGLSSLIGNNVEIINYSFNPKQTHQILQKNKDLIGNTDYIFEIQFFKQNPKYNMLCGHAYTLKNYNRENGIVTITNPHRSGYDIQIPENEVLPYIQKLSIAHFKS